MQRILISLAGLSDEGYIVVGNKFELSMMNCEALTFVVAQLHAFKVVQGYQCLGNALLWKRPNTCFLTIFVFSFLSSFLFPFCYRNIISELCKKVIDRKDICKVLIRHNFQLLKTRETSQQPPCDRYFDGLSKIPYKSFLSISDCTGRPISLLNAYWAFLGF